MAGQHRVAEHKSRNAFIHDIDPLRANTLQFVYTYYNTYY